MPFQGRGAGQNSFGGLKKGLYLLSHSAGLIFIKKKKKIIAANTHVKLSFSISIKEYLHLYAKLQWAKDSSSLECSTWF